MTVDTGVLGAKLREIISSITSTLSEREEKRDAALKKSRDVIRLSGWAITSLLKGDLREAEKHLDSLRRAVEEFLEKVRSDPVLYYSGFTNNALSEYVEAMLLYSIVVRGEIPSHLELGVPEVPYLQGLGDTVGELRRLALELLRQDRVEEAEKLVGVMETIYYELRGIDFPEALAPGVRHKADVARRLVDDTKALLLEIKGRREVLKLVEEKLGSRETKA